jgi:hypothetical protein
VDEETSRWRSNRLITVDEKFQMENEEDSADCKRMKLQRTKQVILVQTSSNKSSFFRIVLTVFFFCLTLKVAHNEYGDGD